MIIPEKLIYELIDKYGRYIIDYKNLCLELCEDRITVKSRNKTIRKKYPDLRKLTDNQKKLLIDLVSKNINLTICELFNKFYENSEWMKLMFIYQDKEYDLLKVAKEYGIKIDKLMIKHWLHLYATKEIS